MELLPASSAAGMKLGGEGFFRGGHHVAGTFLGAVQEVRVFGRLFRAGDKSLDVEGADPGGEAVAEEGYAQDWPSSSLTRVWARLSRVSMARKAWMYALMVR